MYVYIWTHTHTYTHTFKFSAVILCHVQVGTVEAAKKAAAAGVDAVIVQGVEAGGHVIGQVLFD